MERKIGENQQTAESSVLSRKDRRAVMQICASDDCIQFFNHHRESDVDSLIFA